jgi:hypothetical protein
MQIAKMGDEQFRLTISTEEVRIFINCMNETIKRIPGREYQTRMGAEIQQIKAAINSLEATLK